MPLTRSLRALCVAAAGLALALPAGAAVILDNSPDAIGVADAFNGSNTSGGQNFATPFSVVEETILTGIDSWDLPIFASVGDPVRVRVFGDAGGAPGSLLHDIAASVSITDTDGDLSGTYERRFAAFSATVAAGTYFIGVSGEGGSQLSQLLVNTVGGGTCQMSGTVLSFCFGDRGTFDTAAIRVYGDPATARIPLPAGLPLLAAGIGGLALLRRRAG